MNKKTTSAGIIIIAAIMICIIPFIPQSLVDEYGWPLLLSPIGIVLIALIIGFVLVNKKTKVDELGEKRQGILIELKEAEKQFLQHKINQPTFDSISKEKNAELIRLEAEIDTLKNVDLTKKETKDVSHLSADKKKILKGLLEQRQTKVHELKLSEQSYLKRKIDEDTYQKISSDIKREIISIESQIRAIQENEEIAALKQKLKEGASEIAKQKKTSVERQKINKEEELEEDIFDQAREKV